MSMVLIDNTVNDSISTNGQSVILDVRRHAAVTVTLTGTWSGTIVFEASSDSVTWVAVNAAPVPSGSTVTSTTANGTWLLNVAAMASLRLRASAWVSGAAAVAVRASVATVPILTPGSIVFANASGLLAEDNANLTYLNSLFSVGSGDTETIYTAYAASLPQRGSIIQGTAASPETTLGPTLKVVRTEEFTRAALEAATAVGNDGAEQAAAIYGISVGTASTETQTVGVYAGAKNAATSGPSGHDACGLYAVGRHSGNGTGIGIFALGRNDYATGAANAAEIDVYNGSGGDTTWNSTGFSRFTGIWSNAIGGNDSGVAFAISNAFGSQYDVGIGFTGQVAGGKTGGVKNTSIYDNGNAATSYKIAGSHTYGIDTRSGTFSGAPLLLGNNTSVAAKNAAGSLDVALFGLDGSDRLALLAGRVTLTSAGVFGTAASATTSGIAFSPTITPGASDADGVILGAGTVATGTTSFTNYFNTHIKAAAKSGTGVITNAYGMKVEAPTIGGTLNAAAYFNGVTMVGNAPAGTSTLDVIALASATGMTVKGSGGNIFVARNSSNASLFFINDSGTFVNGAGLFANTDNAIDIGASGATRFRDLYLARNAILSGAFASGQSATAPDPTTGGTIATATIGVARVAPAGAETGMILAVGTIAGQEVTVVNEAVAANTITFAAQATSHVANGVSTVIAGLTAKRFIWDSGTSLWYPA